MLHFTNTDHELYEAADYGDEESLEIIADKGLEHEYAAWIYLFTK